MNDPIEDRMRMTALNNGVYDPKTGDYDFSFKPVNVEAKDAFWRAHTSVDVMRMMEYNPKIEIESRVLCQHSGGIGYKTFNTQQFKEAYEHGNRKLNKMTEDAFGQGFGNGGYGTPVGRDFVPLLGGPFFKNLYYYTDYIQMHSEAFFAYHNDPAGKAIASITRDFVMGSGYEMQTDTTTRQGEVAMALWKTFEKVNDLQVQMDSLCLETGVYGEIMLWWLPNNNAKITYQLSANDINPKGIVPRVRVIDPSNIVEIVTYPEDITRKLFYVWLVPTQYQIYTGGMGSQQNLGDPIQPTLKYIYQQIPADQMMHYKINAVSNEKRGRSDFYPVFNYMKRLRDSVDFALISLQKNSAWSIDTIIDGNQEDIDNYINQQAQLGTIPPAGSEFIHTKAVERKYLGNSAAGGNVSNAFEWALSMICMGTQIPFNYLGTHLSGGSTRASAIVATEPVAKKMEKRQKVMKRVLTDIWERLMKEAGLGDVPVNVIFPEIITQDRSQKLKDLQTGETNEWFSPQRVATVAAKEMGFTDYNYDKEMAQYEAQKPEIPAILTATPKGQSGFQSPQGGAGNDMDQESSVTKNERQEIKTHGTSY